MSLCGRAENAVAVGTEGGERSGLALGGGKDADGARLIGDEKETSAAGPSGTRGNRDLGKVRGYRQDD
jgi:hypothetical protein